MYPILASLFLNRSILRCYYLLTMMLDNYLKKPLDAVLFSASHSEKIFYRMFSVLVLAYFHYFISASLNLYM